MPSIQNNMGMQGFKWFFGKVEDRNDPLKVGRVRVRIFSHHNDSPSVLPTTHLPWATVMQPVTSAAHQGVGTSPTGVAVGSMVFGFFLDGEHLQQPVVMGTFAGMPNGVNDLPSYADGSVVNRGSLSEGEPSSEAAPQYPFNTVTVSESGHITEIDDTPGKERLHVYHKSGSYAEIGPTGRVVFKSVSDQHNIVANDSTVKVGGALNVSASSTINIDADAGPITITIGGSSITMSSDEIIIKSGKVTIQGDEVVTVGKTKLNNGSRPVVYKGATDSRGDINNTGESEVLV